MTWHCVPRLFVLFKGITFPGMILVSRKNTVKNSVRKKV